MERIYFHARTVGRSQDVLKRIIAIVMNSDMASQIPLVKLERRAKGEFYVFLSRIHRRTALGTALEEARGCSSESEIMVL